MEMEKGLLGLPHVFDETMMRMFHYALSLTKSYNSTSEEEAEKRKSILDAFLEGCGKNLYIVPGFHCEFGTSIVSGMMFSSTRTVC